MKRMRRANRLRSQSFRFSTRILRPGRRDWLQGEVLESQLSYWKEQLHDISILNLPTDRPRPARQSFQAPESQ